MRLAEHRLPFAWLLRQGYENLDLIRAIVILAHFIASQNLSHRHRSLDSRLRENIAVTRGLGCKSFKFAFAIKRFSILIYLILLNKATRVVDLFTTETIWKIMEDFRQINELPINGYCKERNVWNNLRARHYSVLILLAIVTLETSAIAIDRFINREADVAFTIESPFQNNPFIQAYQENEKPAEGEKIVIARTPAKVAAKNSAEVSAPITVKEVKSPTQEKVQSVSASFVAANNKPDSAKPYVEYSIQAGDSLSNIAEMFGSNPEQIQHANQLTNINNIKAGQTIKIPLPTEQMVYTVKKGDSLSKISGRFRVPMQELIKVNNLKSHMLMADQKIRIPVTDNRKNLSMVTTREDSRAQLKNLQIVKNNQLALVPNSKGLQLIRSNKLQIAQAPASKPEVEIIEKELLKAPPVVNSKNVKAADKPVLVTKPAPVKEVVKEEKPQVAAAKPVVVAKPAPAKKVVEEEKAEKIDYKVVRGDSLLKIAHRYDTTAAQIQHDNELKGTLVKIGQKLAIQPGKKLYRVIRQEEKRPQTRIANHKVQRGENLTVIARRYKTTINAIVSENQLSNTMVRAGQVLKVPTNQASKAKQAPSWRMPTRGRLSDRYGYRNHPIHKRRLFHAGIDVAAPRGTPIVAAMAGKVIFAGRRSGYGNLVIISHANGYSTRYAHCNTINVRNGQNIRSGQLIARVGATGLATGNHLHFEIRKNGKPVNPLSYVKH